MPIDSEKENGTRQSIGYTQPIPVRRRAFEGISIAQVVAGAAAAATSMLLASKIGIAGSVIGAAVSSAVTIICSQLYRQALDASAERLRSHQTSRPQTDGDQKAGSPYSAYAEGGSSAQNGPSAAATRPMQRPGSDPKTGNRADAAPSGARVAPAKLQAQAAARRSANQRKVAVASVAIAAAAVLVCAGLILLGTAGEGLGTRPQPIFVPAEQQPAEQEPAPDPSDQNHAGTSDPDPSASSDGDETEGDNGANGGGAADGGSSGSVGSGGEGGLEDPADPDGDPAQGGSGTGDPASPNGDDSQSPSEGGASQGDPDNGSSDSEGNGAQGSSNGGATGAAAKATA